MYVCSYVSPKLYVATALLIPYSRLILFQITMAESEINPVSTLMTHVTPHQSMMIDLTSHV